MHSAAPIITNSGSKASMQRNDGHQNSFVACYAPQCFAVKERLALSEKPAFHVPVLFTAQT